PSAVTRAGLEALMASSPGVELVGSYPALSAVEDLRPDVVLAAVPQAELVPAAAIVLLSGDEQPPWTADAFRAGVRALLPRDATAAAILAAVEAAASGLAVVDPRDLEVLLASATPAPLLGDPPAITARELEVLRMMAEGAA